MTWSAQFFDGSSAVAHDVQVDIAADALVLTADGVPPKTWSFVGLRWVVPPHEAGDCRLVHTDDPDARLIIAEREFATKLRRAFPGIDAAARKHGRPLRSTGIALGAVAGFAAAIFLMVSYLPPVLAPLVPKSIEKRLGDQVVSDLSVVLARAFEGDGSVCRNADGVAALERLTARLAAGGDVPYRVDVLNIDMVNAFAAPGDRVVIMKGLIDFAENADQVAGVLAHELAHVDHRHSMQGLFREIGLGATLQVLLGGGVSDAAIGQMLRGAYSRDDEREADAGGMEMLRRADISPDGMIEVMERFAKMDIPGFEVFQILSTHPDSAERAEALKAQAADATGGPAMSAGDWNALQKICD